MTLVIPHGGKLINRINLNLDISTITHEVEVDTMALSDLELIVNGAYSPLTGFFSKEDYESVLSRLRLKNEVEEAKKVFQTTDSQHPGVKKLFSRPNVYLSGPVHLIKIPPKNKNFTQFYKTPSQIRREFKNRNWNTVVGFQTRNPVHRAHQMTFKGNYADVDITDPSLPKLPTYKSFYDKETLDLVVEIFQDDFLMYQYSKDSLLVNKYFIHMD
ncbi:hypothetical protein [Bacillus sp. FSL K6-0067]|uniref:hypothetical protein n=1 Tax=Bacillus sp. FSL K6-0067 TaxID=2921412 RepID=UPI00077A15B4|nr:hypothetical protein [Bacillus cereus]KXY10835.1 hypothetical protein AT267_17315 [Bacillus cereus]